MKASPKVNVRSAGLEIVARVEGADVLPVLEKAMKDANREYRVGALRLADDYADDGVYASYAAMLPSLKGEAKADVLNWLGTAHAASQIDAVAAAMNDTDAEVVASAVAAASKIGGEMVPHELVERELNEILLSDERLIAVCGGEDQKRGEKLLVFYIDPERVEPEQLVKKLRERGIPNLWIPKVENFILVDELPLLGSGKLDLARLAKLAEHFCRTGSVAGV